MGFKWIDNAEIETILNFERCKRSDTECASSCEKKKRNDANINTIDHKTIAFRIGTIQSSTLYAKLLWKDRHPLTLIIDYII